MATTFVEYTGDGNATKQFTFPSYQSSDVKVRVDGVLKTASTHYNITGYTTTGGGNVVFTSGNIPSSPANIRIYRDTNVDIAKATFTAGSSVKAADLNNNNTQLLYRAQEEQIPNLIQTYDLEDGSVNSAKIKDASIVEGDLANSAVTSNKIADNAVTTTEILNGAVTSAKIADGTIVNADVNASAAIAGTKINPAFGSQNITTSGTVDGRDVSADGAKLDTIETNAKDDQTAAEIRALLQSDKITASEIATGTLDSRYFTETELTNGALDGRYFTETESDARYFNISSGETIKDGDTFPDNDTTIATTAAINDRIIDLIDDVGGFDIIASEQHFPNTNPQGTTGQSAVLSIKEASTNLVPSGTTVTISNGNLANNANITITGVTSTIPTGFGFLVESTSTTHTYAFHRLVPKATEVTTVASNISNINSAANNESNINAAVSNASNINAAVSNASNINAVAGNASNINAAVSNASNINSAVSNASNITTTANSITNVNNVGNNITNVNSVSNSAGANQTFTVTVQNVSGNKYFIDGVQTPVLKLARGKTYTFDMSDSSNSSHPLAFRDSSDNSYTTGVTTSGTAGSSGATVVIVVAANAPSSLKYYCTSHGNSMGNTITVIDDNVGTVAGSISNVNTVGGAISNVNSVGGSISNVNTVASNISSVNSFFNTYRIGSNNPTTSLDTGDLFFNTTSNSLKVYTGSAWVDGVTATGDFAVVTGNTFTGSNNHNDNVKSIYGTGSDLQIYHTGSSSIIRNTTGSHLFIQNSGGNIDLQAEDHIFLKNYDGQTYARFLEDAGTELYFDDSKKLETTSTGVKVQNTGSSALLLFQKDSDALGYLESQTSKVVFGSSNNHPVTISQNSGTALNIDTSKNIQIPNDSAKLEIGAGQDLQLYHDGSHSYANNSTGFFHIRSGSAIRLQKSDGEPMIYAIPDGAVELYHDNAKKLETTSSGITVTGMLNFAAAGTPNISLRDNGKIALGQGDDLQLYHDGTNSYIASNQGELRLTGANGTIRIRPTTAENSIVAAPNAGVELYHDNSKKFETESFGATLSGNLDVNSGDVKIQTDNRKVTFGAGADLQIYHNGTHNYLDSSNGNIYLRVNSTENAIKCTENGNVEISYDGTKKFETTSGGVNVIGALTVNGSAINTDLVSDTTPQLGGNLDTNDKNIVFADSDGGSGTDNRAVFGASSDLQIYHDGGGSKITHANTGDLVINNTSGDTWLGTNGVLRVSNASNNGYMAKFVENGTAELYYDGSKKLETQADGVLVSGKIQANGHFYLTDSYKAQFGSSQDLQIYHDGSNSFIHDTGTGKLLIRTSQLQLEDDANYPFMYGIKDAEVQLFYDGSKKLETTTYGAKINNSGSYASLIVGSTTGDGAYVYLDGDANGDASGSDYGYIGMTNQGVIRIHNYKNEDIEFANNNTVRARFTSSGHFVPQANNTYDLGSSGARWQNVYTNDLNLSNEGGANDVDGTWGDWTIQEGESDLFLKNNRSGKKYKFNLMEVS